MFGAFRMSCMSWCSVLCPHIGGELARTAHVMQGGVRYEWHGEWATWNDLHNSPELKALMCKFEELAARAGKGMKGSGKAS